MDTTPGAFRRESSRNETDGFTLIELLIVIVVLGILAAVVIFALGGITGKSARASCQADGATVSTALAAFNAQNPTVLTNVPGTGANGGTWPDGGTLAIADAYAQGLLSATSYGGPYIQSWPNNLPHYAYELLWVDQVASPSASTPGVWTATLEVSTGASSTGVPSNAAGNLVAAGGSPSSDAVGGTNAPWLPYAGPTTCSGVS